MWNETPPTEPGYYWYDYNGNAYICMVYVQKNELLSVLCGSQMFFVKQPQERIGRWWYPALTVPIP
jgi:hypothetical protein